MKLIPYPKNIKLLDGRSASDNVECIADNLLKNEAYKLVIEPKIVKVYSSSEVGEYYAKITLEQLKNEYGDSVPCCEIEDAPSFSHRAFMLDSARHYQELDEIKILIDEMAKIKLNTFHWHLTDDQGWRIEIDKYPQLNKAAVRSKTTFGKKQDNNPYGRVYSKAELEEIVDYCAKRHINVIPEFDVPGHTSAFLSQFSHLTCNGEKVEVKTRQGIYKSVICPAKDEVYTVLENIFAELCEVFSYEYFHIGGDEVPSDSWSSCPDCKELMQELGLDSYHDYHNYFMNKIAEILKKYGKKAIVWNDTMKGKGLDSDITIQYWKERDKGSFDYVNNGGKMILSPFGSYYLDYDYDISSLKNVYNFKTNLNPINKASQHNILGIEAPLWCEYIDNKNRAQMLVFPRLFAISETAWNGDKKIPYKQFRENCKHYSNQLKLRGISTMDEKKWDYSKPMMVKGWLSFVFKNYSFEYIKSAIKGDL